MKRIASLPLLFLVVCFMPMAASAANPPAPSGPHPRLFLSGDILTGAIANAQAQGTAASNLVRRCQEVIDNPDDYMTRGGADGDYWPGAAVACAFAWKVTSQQKYLDSAIEYWNVALNDDQTKGDGLGCVVGADMDAASLTVRHDTGYPIRWYGPYMALVYDWLHDAPGVDAALLSHTRFCFKAWIDYYSQDGYLRDVPGSNYQAGYVAAKTLIAVAEGGEDGTTSDSYWNSVIDDIFSTTLIGKGLAGSADPVGTPAGAMVGGDWAEGWQYGPLSVLEYAFSARALQDNGVPLPEMETWAGDVALNYIYAQTPTRDGFYSDGDLESDVIYPEPNGRVLRAVYGGSRNTEILGYARFIADAQQLGAGEHPLEAIAEVLGAMATPIDFNATERPLFRLSRGTRRVYARSSWSDDAFWGVFCSAPAVVPDHDHFDAGNFVFSRGGDALVVDPSAYGARSTLPSNAPTIDADTVQGDYKPSQTPWSEAELLWTRGSQSGVVAARGDYAKAFNYSDTPSAIPYARRDWVFLPEGEIVLIDRARTNNPGEAMYLNFHAPTVLNQNGSVSTATVGDSKLLIHTVLLSGGTPTVHAVDVDEGCYVGSCSAGRFASFAYSVQIPGPQTLGVHVFDGLATNEAPADVVSLNEAPYDDGGGNQAVRGVAVLRSLKQSYVVASSAVDGASGPSMAYGVPGASAARHIVFDAPESADGKSDIATSIDDGRCTISITAGTTFAGHPLMFQVSSAADGCTALEDLDVPPTQTPAGGAGGTGGGGTSGGGGITGNGGTNNGGTIGDGATSGTGNNTSTGGTTSGSGGSGDSNPDVDAGTDAASSDTQNLGCDCVVAAPTEPARDGVAMMLTALVGLGCWRRRHTRALRRC